mmetsp:Transcript_68723/g.201197  ORF Transcript_68723/g.201197 Transcript_68723/m.201197 type:complete len:249 (+) Transcript_68723:1010-1756(+)
MSQLARGHLCAVRLHLEVQLALEVLLEVLHDPHEVVAPRHLLDLGAHRLEDGKVGGHLLPQLGVLNLDRHGRPVPERGAVDLRQRGRGDGLALEGPQGARLVQGSLGPGSQRHGLLEQAGHLGQRLVRRLVRKDGQCIRVGPRDTSVAGAAADRSDELRRLHVQASVHGRHSGTALCATIVAGLDCVPVLLSIGFQVGEALVVVLLLLIELHHGDHAPRSAKHEIGSRHHRCRRANSSSASGDSHGQW